MYLNLYFRLHCMNVLALDSEIVLMNIISPKYIREYLDHNFRNSGRYSSGGREFTMPSIFVDDWKNKFSINTSTGMWQDFKAHKVGNFIQFVAQVEKTSYKRAEAKILFEVLADDSPDPKPFIEDISTSLDVDMSSWVPIDIYSCYSKDSLVQLAWKYLWGRKMFHTEETEDEPFYVATDGKYKNRIIIPFKKPSGDLFFFQARALLEETPKYLNPDSTQVRASSVLYPFQSDTTVLICEGPLDARSLQLAGVNATSTMGSSPSQIQIEEIRDMGCELVIAYDNDTAGKMGVDKIERMRRELMMPSIKICLPPKAYKDWNEAWREDMDLKQYVRENTKDYDIEYLINTQIEPR